MQRVVANATKARFNLRQTSDNNDAAAPASWHVRRITTHRDAAAPMPAVLVGDPLTSGMADLPEFIVYETSYQRYPLLVTAGAIARAPGGAQLLAFQPVAAAAAEENELPLSDTAEVTIWIHLRSALEAAVPGTLWQRAEGGAVVTDGEVPRHLWSKAVARRPDIGLLLEDGEVRKEVPAALRGKGAKGKSRKGKGQEALKRDGSEDDSGSASASDE